MLCIHTRSKGESSARFGKMNAVSVLPFTTNGLQDSMIKIYWLLIKHKYFQAYLTMH